METDKTYIMILRDSITNKVHVLESLLELTEEQRRIVKSDNPDIIRFDEIFDEKGRLIDMLNMLDDGFDGIYGKVKDELLSNAGLYKDELLQIRELIDKTTSLGVRLEGLEHDNKRYIEEFIAKKKEEVRSFKRSRSISKSYAKNMTNQHYYGDSYFMDKKK